MICLHCNRDILAYQDRTPLASGGYVHTECYPAWKERDTPLHWIDTAVAILIIVGVIIVVWLFGDR